MSDPKVTSWGNAVFAHTCGLHDLVSWGERHVPSETVTWNGRGRARGSGGDDYYMSGKGHGEINEAFNRGKGSADGRETSRGIVANGGGRATGSASELYENGAGYDDVTEASP